MSNRTSPSMRWAMKMHIQDNLTRREAARLAGVHYNSLCAALCKLKTCPHCGKPI